MAFISKIKTFNDLQEAVKTKENLINEINAEFVKNYNIATIDLTKDLLLNVIPNKINTLINQLKNPVILEAEQVKLKKLNEIKDQKSLMIAEQKSILSIITSNLKFKKSVSSIEAVSSEVLSDQKYVAVVGENGTSFQQVLEGSDIELAKRFIELNGAIEQLNNDDETVNKNFEEAIKDIEYIKEEFYIELQELRNVSKISWFSINDIDENEYYLFYGNEEDYTLYQNQLKSIKALYSEFVELKNSSLK